MKLIIKKIAMGLILGVFTSLSGCGEPAFVGDTGEPAGGGFTKPASAEYAINVSGTGTGGSGTTRSGGTPATVISGESFDVTWNVALNTNVTAWDIRIYWSETAAVTNASLRLFDETCDSAGQVCSVPFDDLLSCTYTQAQTGNGGNITCNYNGTETANVNYTFASNPVFMVFEACGVGTNNCDTKGIIVNLS